MRRFQPLEAVVSALKDSRVLDVVDQDSCVQRKVPFTLAEGTQQEIFKIIEDESLACSVYVKGFGEEKPDTQFKIEGFFMPHGTTNQVRLRRAKDKTFKGSVFVEFENEETAKKFIGLDPQPTYEGCKLTIKSKKQYMEEKAALYADGKLKKSDDNRDRLQSSRWTRGGRGGRGSRGFGRGRGGRESKDNGRDSRSSRYRDEAKKYVLHI